MTNEDSEPVSISVSEDVVEGVRVHSIPARIGYSGPAPVIQYFGPSIQIRQSNTADSRIEAIDGEFRGHPLIGHNVTVPAGCYGYILETPNDGTSPDRKIIGTFDTLTCWDWDRLPNDNDQLPRFLRWASLADKWTDE